MEAGFSQHSLRYEVRTSKPEAEVYK